MEFRSIDELSKKGQLSGEEKLPVSPTEYVSTEQISRHALSVINVDKLYPLLGAYYYESKARETIKGDLRVKGIVITYQRSQNEWTTERFVGNLEEVDAWYDSANWVVETQSYRKTINRDEIQWYEDKYIHIPHISNLVGLLITNIDLKVRIGTGLKSVTASVFYPPSETNTANVPNGFYVSDSEGIICRNTDFGAIYISYDIQVRSESSFQYSRTRYETGRNIIISHNLGDEFHANSVANTITAVYPDFENQIIRTELDVDLQAKVTNKHKAKYVENKNADCIVIPYQNATVVENCAAIADILQVTPHYGNVFERRDIGETVGEKFKHNTIAVGARVNDTTTQAGSSFGNALEFFESTGNQNLNALYPETTFLFARFVCTLNANPILLDLPTATGINVPPNALEFGVGTTVYVGQSGNMQEAVIVNWSVNQIQLDRALSALPAGTNYIYNNVHIGTIWQSRIFLDYPTNL